MASITLSTVNTWLHLLCICWIRTSVLMFMVCHVRTFRWFTVCCWSRAACPHHMRHTTPNLSCSCWWRSAFEWQCPELLCPQHRLAPGGMWCLDHTMGCWNVFHGSILVVEMSMPRCAAVWWYICPVAPRLVCCQRKSSRTPRPVWFRFSGCRPAGDHFQGNGEYSWHYFVSFYSLNDSCMWWYAQGCVYAFSALSHEEFRFLGYVCGSIWLSFSELTWHPS